jgi:serine/threonine protein kinase
VSAEPKPDWTRVKQLFGQAVELEAAARAEFLDAACASEAELRQEVESLIASHVAAEAAALFELPAASGLVAEPSWEGRRIGPYRVLAEIGRGGMGTVFRAVRDDDQYRKAVAIKLVKGDLDAPLRHRFEAERQILAGLEHPGIAHLLDGGTTEDGLPYLVMDYVEGEPITDYAEKRQLPVAARLRLFREVCAAVHYAHQKLVVHRDIKPGNILVDAAGTPRLLDFGIARLVSPAAEFTPTLTLLRPMTPEYASPEQILGQALTTATDVYSLGVLLCELLCGERPYRFSTHDPQEWLRVVVEMEPERPSVLLSRRGDEHGALAHKLRGDLDNIVLMALRKEPERRYASADQLAEDVRRHQDGRPVIARPATIGYRASKFLGRNRGAVAAGSACVIALLAATSGSARSASWRARSCSR